MVTLLEMTEGPKDTKVFHAHVARYGLWFFGFSLMFGFGVWLTFIACDETIASYSRRPPLGDATGPITMVIFGPLCWFLRPFFIVREHRDLVLSPSGFRYGGFSVRWSQVSTIKRIKGAEGANLLLSLIHI